MKIEHNSRNEFYRRPFGAVTENDEVTIRLGIKDGGIPESVRLVYFGRDREEKSINMPYVTGIGEYCFYEALIPAQKTCGNV